MDHSIKRTDRPPYGIIAVLMIGAFISIFKQYITKYRTSVNYEGFRCGYIDRSVADYRFYVSKWDFDSSYGFFNSKIFGSPSILSSHGFIYTRDDSRWFCPCHFHFY